MKMEKRKFRIGQLAEHLEVKSSVIRFWEKEFSAKSDRSQGGQRFYDNQDLERFTLIKNLLYEKKFTIEGARLEIQKTKGIIPSKKTVFTDQIPSNHLINSAFKAKLLELREKLQKLKEIL